MDTSFFFLMLLLLGMAAYYSFVVFPKQREYRKKKSAISQLKVGDEIVTFGGVIGTIVEMDRDRGIAFVEIAEGVVIRLLMAALMQVYDPDEVAGDFELEQEQQPVNQ